LAGVDLHIHTVYSDGTFTPEEVVKLAKEKGLIAISITDHDSVAGIEEALKAGERWELEVVPGVEMSTDVGEDEIHILGYYLDWKHKEFLDKLDFLQEVRIKRNEKLLKRLKELGMWIDPRELDRLAPKGVVSRLHIARCMVEKGYVRSIDEAFEEWLNPGKPAYIERIKISPFEVIGLILEAGGIPVLAHPFLSRRDDLIPRLVEAGLEGIEAYHSTHDVKITRHYIEIAHKYDLIVTGGSDCHGEAKDEVLIGKVYVPETVLRELKKFKEKKLERIRDT